MKTIFKYFSLFFISLPLFFGQSCSEDFLTKEPKLDQSNELVLSTFKGLTSATNGAYAYLCDATWYGRDFEVTADLKGGNAKISPITSGRFVNEYLWNNTPSATAGFFSLAYKSIAASNNVLEVIDNGFTESGVDATEIENLKGQCLFIRALSYFDLVRMYAQPYAAGTNNLGVAVVLRTENGIPARNTVGEVYTRILADLTEAEELITEETATNVGSLYAVKALLAKVYLYMENWQKAADYATEVIDNGDYSLFSASDYSTYEDGGYWGGDGSGSEIIFQVDISEGNSYHGNWDVISYITNPEGYGDIGTSEDLLSLYETDDVRAKLFQNTSDYPASYWTLKYIPRLGNKKEANVPVLRLSEMYLIRSEAVLNGASASATALEDYNAIRTNRNLTDASSVSLSDIYNERRRELCFEGNELFDLARTQRSLTRVDFGGSVNQNVPFTKGGSASVNYLWAMPIPQHEIDANENCEQNPGY